jgi:cytochrome c biogenesis protein CcmG, thiol:disulfide interchange protein DsbE
MTEQPFPAPAPDPDPAPRRTWTARVRGLSTTTKVVYAVAAVAIVAIVVIALTGVASGKPKAGPLPLARNFNLTELGVPGHTVSLSQYTGRPVIVNFFASWCVPCKHETPLIASFYRHMDGRVAIIGIDADDHAAKALSFMHAAGVRYPVGFDPTPGVTDSYGVIAIPQTFFLNAEHRIVKRVFGAVTLKELTEGVALMDSHQGSPATSAEG